jgi:AraC-like DNA-binding protein
MLIVLAGEIRIGFDEGEFSLAPGAALMGTCDHPCTIDFGPNAEHVTIKLRRSLLTPLVRNIDDRAGHIVPAESPALQLLLGYLRILGTEDALATPELRRLVTTHVYELAALAFGATDASLATNEGARAARLAAVKADVLANLADPNLSVAAVAGRHKVTPRYIHILFEAEGETFTEFVLGQRLVRAHRMLCDPRHAVRAINAIAFEVGFGDLSYFNRTFRRRFGSTPSDVRAAALAAKAADGEPLAQPSKKAFDCGAHGLVSPAPTS